MDSTTLMIIAAILVALVVLLRSRKDSKSDGGTPSDPHDPSSWEIGPIMNGNNASQGVPLHPSAQSDGLFFIDIPYPTPDVGHVHYVTMPTGPLTGKTKIRLRYRLEAEEGVKIVPRNFPDAPSIITLYFQRKGDDWSAQGEYETYRWYAGFANKSPVTVGEYVLEAPLDGNWGAILTSRRETNPTGFQAALDNTGRVGFVLGGGDGAGHGVYATGPARLVILSFEIE